MIKSLRIYLHLRALAVSCVHKGVYPSCADTSKRLLELALCSVTRRRAADAAGDEVWFLFMAAYCIVCIPAQIPPFRWSAALGLKSLENCLKSSLVHSLYNFSSLLTGLVMPGMILKSIYYLWKPLT